MSGDDTRERKLRAEALAYHESEPRGKVKVVPTKPHGNARELSLAYSPGVAYPCLEIAERPEDASFTEIDLLMKIKIKQIYLILILRDQLLDLFILV